MEIECKCENRFEIETLYLTQTYFVCPECFRQINFYTSDPISDEYEDDPLECPRCGSDYELIREEDSEEGDYGYHVTYTAVCDNNHEFTVIRTHYYNEDTEFDYEISGLSDLNHLSNFEAFIETLNDLEYFDEEITSLGYFEIKDNTLTLVIAKEFPIAITQIVGLLSKLTNFKIIVKTVDLLDVNKLEHPNKLKLFINEDIPFYDLPFSCDLSSWYRVLYPIRSFINAPNGEIKYESDIEI